MQAQRPHGHRDRRVRRADDPVRGGLQPRPGAAPDRREPGARRPGHRRVQHDEGVRRPGRRSRARVLRGLDAGRRGHPREDGLATGCAASPRTIPSGSKQALEFQRVVDKLFSFGGFRGERRREPGRAWPAGSASWPGSTTTRSTRSPSLSERGAGRAPKRRATARPSGRAPRRPLMAVTVTPETFTFVNFDAGARSRRVTEQLLDRGRPARPISTCSIEVDETTPLGPHRRVDVARPDRHHGRERRVRGTRKPPRQLRDGRRRRRRSAGCCFRAADRLDPALRRRAARRASSRSPSASAWDAYCVGRLERLGYRGQRPALAVPLPQPPRLHRRRRRRVRPALGRRRAHLGRAVGVTDDADSAVAASRGVIDRDPHRHAAHVNGVDLDVLDRAGRRPPSCCCATASPELRTRGATRCVPLGRGRLPRHRARPARLRRLVGSASVDAYGITQLTARPVGLLDDDGEEQARVRRPRLGRPDRVGSRPAASRAGARRRGRERAAHRTGRRRLSP